MRKNDTKTKPLNYMQATLGPLGNPQAHKPRSRKPKPEAQTLSTTRRPLQIQAPAERFASWNHRSPLQVAEDGRTNYKTLKP